MAVPSQLLHISMFLMIVLFMRTASQGVTHRSQVNEKRGLIFLYNSTFPNDYEKFVTSDNVLSWYYNYGQKPSSQLANLKWQFVPMVWGKDRGKYIRSNIDIIRNTGKNVSFNEPEMPNKWGGSEMSPQVAASEWMKYLEPLSTLGIYIGTPGVSSSPKGFDWLTEFSDACSNCTFSMLCLHHYGRPALSLKKHLERYHDAFPRLPIWLTEYADSKDTPEGTARYMNETLVLLDSLPYIERYSYFGASRESNSRVGPNAALLDDSGNLKTIGGVYLFSI